ncbi:MAG: hypothetical protein AB1668_03525 [Nanoarchaeota archaeon]
MGWLFARKKKVPQVPFPEKVAADEKALKFPTRAASSGRVIEPGKIKEVAGVEQAPVQAPITSFPPLPKEEKSFFGKPHLQEFSPGGFEEARLPPSPPKPQELYVKLDVYRRIILERDSVKERLNNLFEVNKVLETSEYNEESNFSRLKRSMTMLHNNLLEIDKIMFKSQGD